MAAPPEWISGRPAAGAPADPSRPAEDGATLSERLAREMARCWERGERPLAEDFLGRHPALWQQPEAAVDLIYEELCLRQQHGPATTAAELGRRFPQWRPQLAVLLEFHRLLEANLARPLFPAPGEELGDFVLVSELGRGPRSRVFLATQPSLAGRRVVVKVVPRDGREYLSLARLQHSHIVPLYAVQDEPARDLRLLCMPYFGGTTLDRLPGGAAGGGRAWLEALDRAREAGPGRSAARCPGRDFLARAAHVPAVCWVGACLAEALHYAHERGLVHLDVKPSNVLLTADAQPMLLDFHLARGPLAPGAPAPDSLGGTRAYMSPEQRRAVEAVRSGQQVPAAVDGRSDIYSLGLLLYQALGGPVPPPAGAPPRLERCNRQVSVGLADVVHKALAARPADRYPDAAALAGDLRRHLADLPLRGVRNRSWAERWRKWRRRSPHALRQLTLALSVLLAAAAGVAHFALADGARRGEARRHLEHGRRLRQGGEYGAAVEALRHGLSVAQGLPLGGDLRHLVREELQEARLQECRSLLQQGGSLQDGGRHDEAVASLRRGLECLETLPGRADLSRAFQDRLHLAERARAARELHERVSRLRFRYGDASRGSRRAWEADGPPCLVLWAKRAWLARPAEPDLAPAVRQQVRDDLLDLAVLAGDCRARWSADGAGPRDALRILGEAEELFGPSRVLCHDRQRLAERLGLTKAAQEAGRRAAALTPRTAWEHYALGRALLRDGQMREAAASLRQAVRLQPAGPWPNFYEGVCAYRRGRHGEAVTAFTACVALEPGCARCYCNRGLAFAGLGQPDRALDDFDQALRLEPGQPEAALNRALLHLKGKRYGAAAADLRRALDGGADPALAHYTLAVVRRAQGDREAALASLHRALQHDPGHEGARQLLRLMRPGP
jgi:serine/threonine protein kinase/Flp pilus assembly protein TadD